MLAEKFIEPERCELCGVEHEPEYPHMFNGLFTVNFVNEHRREPTEKDTYSHCKGIIFESAERYYSIPPSQRWRYE